MPVSRKDAGSTGRVSSRKGLTRLEWETGRVEEMLTRHNFEWWLDQIEQIILHGPCGYSNDPDQCPISRYIRDQFGWKVFRVVDGKALRKDTDTVESPGIPLPTWAWRLVVRLDSRSGGERRQVTIDDCREVLSTMDRMDALENEEVE